MKLRTNLFVVVASVAVGSFCYGASAQVLFRDQMTSGALWDVNASGTDYAATFGYNYSADGIPEAPNTQAGDVATTGLKLEANLTTGTGQFFTAYPLGQNFTGNYQLRFDAWMNYGTSGTTEFLGGGVQYNNSDADLTSGVQAIATGDGGSSEDWRAFDNGNYYPLGNGNTSPYVDFLPSVNGSTAGSPGFQWITWEFDVIGGNVNIWIEKPDKSRLELTSISPTSSDGKNISLFYADFFSSLGGPEAFGLIDNVEVNVVPEPTSLALGLLGGLGMLLAARRRK